MSKVLDATCAAGVVTSEGVPVTGADILSEGVGVSEGLLIMDEYRKTYVTSNAEDIKDALTAIASALGQLVTALTVIDAKPVGGVASAPAPGAAANIAQLVVLQTQLNTLKGMLK